MLANCGEVTTSSATVPIREWMPSTVGPCSRLSAESARGGSPRLSHSVEHVVDEGGDVEAVFDRGGDLRGDEVLHGGVVGQRCEGRDEPVGVDQLHPRPAADGGDRGEQQRDDDEDARDHAAHRRSPARAWGCAQLRVLLFQFAQTCAERRGVVFGGVHRRASLIRH